MSIINFLPEDYLAKRERGKVNVIFFAVFAAIMFVVISSSMGSRVKYQNELDKLTALEKEYQQAAVTVTEIQNLQTKQARLKAKNDRIMPLIDRVPKSLLLAMMTNARPDNVSILASRLDTRFPRQERRRAIQTLGQKAMNSSKQANQPTASAIRTDPIVTLSITGLAHTDVEVAQFIANLNASGIMKSVSLGYSEEKKFKEMPDTLLRKFMINCEIKQKADARNIERIELFKHTKKEDDNQTISGVES